MIVIKSAAGAAFALRTMPADPHQLEARWIEIDPDHATATAAFKGADEDALESLAWATTARLDRAGRAPVHPVEIGIHRGPAWSSANGVAVEKGTLVVSFALDRDAFAQVATGRLSPCGALTRVAPLPTKG